MSSQSRTWDSRYPLPQQIGGPPVLSRPTDWTLSTAWQRAQEEQDDGGPINDAERIVCLSDGEGRHRVLWALKGQTLLAGCDCDGYHYHDGWCAHVASLWWQWVQSEIVVNHLDTGREYPAPPAWLRLDDSADPSHFDNLTPAELDAYLTIDEAGVGVREYARHTDRAHGTLTNLLRRARDKLRGGER